MSCGVGLRFSSDPALLWLWCRLAAIAPIGPLAWELPHAASETLKNKQTNKNNKTKKKRRRRTFLQAPTHFSLRCEMMWLFWLMCLGKSCWTCMVYLLVLWDWREFASWIILTSSVREWTCGYPMLFVPEWSWLPDRGFRIRNPTVGTSLNHVPGQFY